MKKYFYYILVIALKILVVTTEASVPDISIRFIYNFISTPLTTEKIWALDPEEPNPHRKVWVLSRKVELKGLFPRELKEAYYGVSIEGLEVITQTYIREAGPWYQSFDEFSCKPEPDSGFSTPEGSRKATEIAAKYWEEVLRQQKIKLAAYLQRVSENSPEAAMKKAEDLYLRWFQDVTSEWKRKGLPQVRRAEWHYYLKLAFDIGICPLKKIHSKKNLHSPQNTRVAWKNRMEPLPSQRYSGRHLARAPAKRWNGLFSVRLSFHNIRSKILNGQFLLDSSARMSIVSPAWLKKQGVLPIWVEVPGATPQWVTWSGGSGLARKATFKQEIEMSGYSLPIQDFLLFDTLFFEPPQTLGMCCDGVLGIDFFKKNVVEFQTSPPYEIKLWPREGFHLSLEEYVWIEAELSDQEELISSCDVLLHRHPKKNLRGVRWDTGSDVALDIHLPWQNQFRGKEARYDLQCSGQSIAQNIMPSLPHLERGIEAKGIFSKSFPAINMGMPVLSRGTFFLDLPHGRIWFKKESLKKKVSINKSGLVLDYSFQDGERVLQVVDITKKSWASLLQSHGLKNRTIITQIDSIPTEDLDLWEVEQRLAGIYGKTVTLQWQKGDEVKIVPLQVRENE